MIEGLRHHAFGIVCVVLLLVAFGLMLIKTLPVHVLKDFDISTDHTTYNRGDTLLLSSHATKLRKASGIAHRTIECDNGKDKVVDYVVNSSAATNPPGKSGRPYNIVVPSEIANIPVQCRVVVAINYRLFTLGRLSLRTITENAVSNNFTVGVE